MNLNLYFHKNFIKFLQKNFNLIFFIFSLNVLMIKLYFLWKILGKNILEVLR